MRTHALQSISIVYLLALGGGFSLAELRSAPLSIADSRAQPGYLADRA